MIKIMLAQMFIFPAALLCYLPMKNRLRFGWRPTAAIVASALLTADVFAAWLRNRFVFNPNLLLLLLIPLFLVMYHFTLRVRFCQSLAVFSSVASLYMIITNCVFSLTFVLAGYLSSRLEYQIMMCLVCLPVSALLFYPAAKYGSFVVENLSYANVWHTAVVLSACIFANGILIKPVVKAPEKAEALDLSTFASQLVLLAFWLLLHVLFYFCVKALMERSKIETSNRMLMMRGVQFDSQQRYIKASERTRHDFRQSVRTMRELYDAGEMEELGRYLHEYEKKMPTGEIVYYTEHAPLNALLNFYRHVSGQNAIRFQAKICLPAALPVSDVDLCTVIGNILENAVIACKATEDRFIDLAVLTENDAQLFIVATNSFDGKARKEDQQYLSTRHTGEAHGLASVTATVEAYGGLARFSHEGSRFFSNIAIPLKQES